MLAIQAQFNFNCFREKRWFFLAMALGAFTLTLPLPEGLSRDGMIVLAMSDDLGIKVAGTAVGVGSVAFGVMGRAKTSVLNAR